ncbi:hypothetical protein DFH08DRAFT_810235 [Mycena albidolilacea]|uniref:Uncharacterized protein n=1 Tax=Mycena albidolilacea TaxID=1033008 RepID=A0AAD6ZZ66_9AGAR|nr:hypothetical protein DFH08DRAFT_810235 [Mycena albidolilacea]
MRVKVGAEQKALHVGFVDVPGFTALCRRGLNIHMQHKWKEYYSETISEVALKAARDDVEHGSQPQALHTPVKTQHRCRFWTCLDLVRQGYPEVDKPQTSAVPLQSTRPSQQCNSTSTLLSHLQSQRSPPMLAPRPSNHWSTGTSSSAPMLTNFSGDCTNYGFFADQCLNFPGEFTDDTSSFGPDTGWSSTPTATATYTGTNPGFGTLPAFLNDALSSLGEWNLTSSKNRIGIRETDGKCGLGFTIQMWSRQRTALYDGYY